MKSLTPKVNAKYGAPMGRVSDVLDPDLPAKARRVTLQGGYDTGGAYWGCRLNGEGLWVVWQMAGDLVAFVDARTKGEAISKALLN